MRLEYQDSIDKYLLNRMSDDERTAFEKSCVENPELMEQFEHTRDVQFIISERSELLTKFQKWDDDYYSTRKGTSHYKQTWLYGLSGVAAVTIAGYFLFFNSKIAEPESSGELVAMNDNHNVARVDSAVNSPQKEPEEQKELLAQNDLGKKNEKNSYHKQDDNHVLSFGENGTTTASPPQTDEGEIELSRVIERKNELTKKLSYLEEKRVLGEIDQAVYESSVNLLKNQRDLLCWRESIILLDMNRKDEALAVLDKLRKGEGQFQYKADSLYNELKNN